MNRPGLDGHDTAGWFINPDIHNNSLYSASQVFDDRVIETTRQLPEFSFNRDTSGTNDNLLGIGWIQSSIKNGVRVSSSTSYLTAANGRPNLTILINSMVTKLLPTCDVGGLKAFRTVQFTDSRTSSGEIYILQPSINEFGHLHFV